MVSPKLLVPSSSRSPRETYSLLPRNVLDVDSKLCVSSTLTGWDRTPLTSTLKLSWWIHTTRRSGGTQNQLDVQAVMKHRELRGLTGAGKSSRGEISRTFLEDFVSMMIWIPCTTQKLCGDKISVFWLIKKNINHIIFVTAACLVLMYVFFGFRTWKRPQVHPDQGWFQACCMAQKELPSTQEEALRLALTWFCGDGRNRCFYCRFYSKDSCVILPGFSLFPQMYFDKYIRPVLAMGDRTKKRLFYFERIVASIS